ncbi:LysM peptidoglycan-binding domain-containing protein [Diplocloster agilis]|uniref:LysM peptidoglycan-binding domain-containing protein n=1 Tax=Diplocloster agilis TaxID=2850323 RepID=UPI00082312F0|nr:LysM domain-containing protein [Suonthocola fibrivorans]MCU6732356.1 LysM peptidoglycan-binding domain-containing protein [Suonthocola fibrivorans]SCI44305.1 LysM domain/BON superfamily protein [uncultured Clostridium sp.]
MIEVIYNEEEQTGGGETEPVRLPKNVRQIGVIDDKKKIYVEDYVITYLNQLADTEDAESKTAVLLGEAKRQEGCQYLFINSAIEAEHVEKDEEGIRFTEDTWTGIYETIKKFFDNREIVGWYRSMPGFALEAGEDILSAHTKNFAGNQKVFFMREPLEKEDAFFFYENGQLVKQHGYYIYYEKNEPMQEYMIYKHEGVGIEPVETVPDTAAVSFRTVMQDKKDTGHQKRIMTFMYTASTFLVLIVFVIGINMINNYDKMQNIEATLNNINDTITAENGGTSQNTEGIPVQSVAGNVAPQTAPQSQENPAGQQQAGENQPEGQAPAEQPADPNAAAPAEQPVDPNAAAPAEQPADPAGEQPGGQPEDQPGEQPADPAGEQPAEQEPAEQPAGQPETPAEPASNSLTGQYYTVQKGDTLAKISKKLYGTYSKVDEICQLNGIDNGDRILAGDKIQLP